MTVSTFAGVTVCTTASSDIADRRDVDVFGAYENDIGAFSLRQGARHLAEAERLRAIYCCHFDDFVNTYRIFLRSPCPSKVRLDSKRNASFRTCLAAQSMSHPKKATHLHARPAF